MSKPDLSFIDPKDRAELEEFERRLQRSIERGIKAGQRTVIGIIDGLNSDVDVRVHYEPRYRSEEENNDNQT